MMSAKAAAAVILAPLGIFKVIFDVFFFQTVQAIECQPNVVVNVVLT